MQLPDQHRLPAPSGRVLRALLAALALWAGAALTGCAALSNPVLEGVPVRRLPPELLGKPRDATVTIPLTVLSQPRPPDYRLDTGDILGVYVEGIFERARAGEPPVPPPVHFPDALYIQPSMGYPIPVRADGTIALPLIKPLQVRGLTVEEVQDVIRRAYTEAQVLQPGRERITVSLARERTYRVVVLRQETGGFNSGPEGITGISLISGTNKLGNGHVVDLRAYENDVLNALARTGGLPGLDACNEVVVMRKPSDHDRAVVEMALQSKNPDLMALLSTLACPIVKIPLRVKPSEFVPPRPQDIILDSGDVVFLEERTLDYFYTGGLLPSGEWLLPRDRDLDVIQAISFVHGPLVSGDFVINNVAVQPVIQPGIGFPSARLLTVLRRTPDGGVIPIRVDLDRALCDPRERILVLPQDVLILQDTPGDALARYLSEQFHFDFTYNVFQNSRGRGTVSGVVP
jgi:protein involved in polysaccharide export with SLBB domain